jgi:hypothetical protein
MICYKYSLELGHSFFLIELHDIRRSKVWSQKHKIGSCRVTPTHYNQVIRRSSVV